MANSKASPPHDPLGRQESGRLAPPADTLGGFCVRVLAAVLIAGTVYLLWTVHDIFLLLLAAVLVAVILRAAAGGLKRLVPMPETLALIVAGLLILAALGFAGALFGQEVSRQMSTLQAGIPETIEQLRQYIGEERMRAIAGRLAPDGEMVAGMLQSITGIVTATLTGLVLAVIGGVFLAAGPRFYRHGTLHLLPHSVRSRTEEFFSSTGTALRRWLLARLAAMVAIGIITYAGLVLIGVPSPLALALIAGLLEFVPFVGPIVAAVPALLLSLTLGPQALFLTAGLYLLVQQIEGNIITPLFLERAVDLPPAVTLFAVFLFGALFGTVGVLLAGPLTVLFYIAARVLWMKGALNEDVEPVGSG